MLLEVAQTKSYLKVNILTASVASICFFFDALSKQWANNSLTSGSINTFVPGVLNLCLTKNTGVAFGIAKGSGILLVLFSAAIIIALLFWTHSRQKAQETFSPIEHFGMGMLLGGAFGNLIERLFVGRVTDFLDFAFISFPVFNVADVCIDVGVGLLLIASLQASKKQA